MSKALSRITRLFAVPAKSGEEASHRLIEFPKSRLTHDDDGFQNLPDMIRDAFLCDFKEGRTDLWGWNYLEVQAAMTAFRARRGESFEKVVEWPQSPLKRG